MLVHRHPRIFKRGFPKESHVTIKVRFFCVRIDKAQIKGTDNGWHVHLGLSHQALVVFADFPVRPVELEAVAIKRDVAAGDHQARCV